MNDEIRVWLRYAEENLEAAQFLLAQPDFEPDDALCGHCLTLSAAVLEQVKQELSVSN